MARLRVTSRVITPSNVRLCDVVYTWRGGEDDSALDCDWSRNIRNSVGYYRNNTDYEHNACDFVGATIRS